MPKLECAETQNLLDAFADNALDGITSLAVQDHLDACAHCRVHWQWSKELAASLDRLAMATPSADAYLRTNALANPHAISKKSFFEIVPRLRRRLAAAAILIALIAGGAALFLRGSTPAAMDFVRNHTEFSGNEYLDTSDLAEARNWIAGRLRGPATIPREPPEGFRLAGVRICRMTGDPVAQIIYRHGDQRISFYLTDSFPEPLRGLDHAVRERGSLVWTGECEGRHLAVWNQSNRSYVLVGDIPPGDLLALANKMTAQL